MKVPSVIVAMMMVLISYQAFAEDEPDNNPKGLKTVKLSPKVHITSSRESYFASIPCTQVANIKPANEDESRYLEKRKKNCFKRYNAFTR